MGAEDRIRQIGERVLQTVARQAWLDKPSYKVERAITLSFRLLRRAGPRVRSLLHGTWLGHPLHPVLTDVPVGAWTVAAILDGVRRIGPRRDGAAEAAQLAVGVGIVGGLASALTGVTDWLYTHDNARRIGIAHGALNAAALTLYGASWWCRRTARDGPGQAASGLGTATSTTSSRRCCRPIPTASGSTRSSAR